MSLDNMYKLRAWNRIASIKSYINKDIEIVNTDFLVVGTGIAGLYTALKLSSLGKVTILTKEQLEDSNTQFAQGGIAAVLDQGDSWQLHMKDTLKAGAGLCNRKAVEVLVTEGPGRVKELIRLGTSFDLIEGELDLTREGAHSRRRILHARGDATGVEIRESLTRVISGNPNINVQENSFMIEILKGHLKGSDDREDYVSGILALNDGKPVVYKSSAVILASGGCSRVYANTSNPPVTTGDGVAAAYRTGADIMDMEFVQFHPTTFYNPDGPSFLISESVRGEGAVLRNKSGKRFMPEYHHLADLAPRDIVARAIVNEARKDDMPYVYLDVTELDSDYTRKRFPTIYNTLKKYNIDMTEEMIPVIPAAHYLMGGIKTDTYGHTNLKGLYACGEVACTGVHGANRLASNSLLEGLVFGHRIYESIKGQIEEELFFQEIECNEIKINDYNHHTLTGENDEDDNLINKLDNKADKDISNNNAKDIQRTTEFANQTTADMRKRFQYMMTEKAGIRRNKKELEELIEWIEGAMEAISCRVHPGLKEYELINMLTNGKLIARSALLRKESRGGHYRSDYKACDKEWSKKHIVFNNEYPEGKEYVFE